MHRLYAFRGLHLLLVVLGVVTVPPTFSVAQMVGGTISGVVLDPSNAPLDQARVVIRNEETATERNLT
ncbi:MAG TPA: carboxypeptidase-like regulatory domain-containing protein, partial [Silvibacterium sp.]|nr:carboxypeptidase-like regulatory domain-containing protein [Silvibacterium sp.]